ncbi:bifunctional [glutamate--ammonia ligase]-adenylyl-L-tyrosine phosphorylase/[glutamate--ammonia-ligase] adenylyltransferase [Phytohalomonas tamaricis]|uniref:bifunctional [glutamate--ammonia ligase]-adenylyl-L-tyrosine phosphorylase/[glutamate--ammonia-ligase] adenylyltransferase n=1 Tax=Phytohalomonas tamaricis TaxID=2081032 RepID=UPI000D0AE317|nr:bifunctional [glutamate--ammonia ligase]-adenylyl-L-tyrosine phosphorylase/[glutamate--ammonia-ligase] adenylyltransferase [Phytohalomonas tamaricis]
MTASFAPFVNALPDLLGSCARQALDNVNDALLESLDDARREQLVRVVALSDFAAESLTRDSELLRRLIDSGELEHAIDARPLWQALFEAVQAAEDEATLHAIIRRFRRARMVAIIWRDLTGASDMWETASAVTRLAEVCLEAALAWLEAHFAPRWGLPQPDGEGRDQRLVVLGMGKLGAGELNLSSDIDLIFAYPERGTTQGGKRAYDHQEYFTKLGQKLIAALDAITIDGFAFRVDMRLRPLGDGGPLVGNFNTLMTYYQDQGREWERYAMLKARPVAGDIDAGHRLLAMLKPFIYRRYIDFGAIESLREMKQMINREVKRRGMESNIKLGSGGIREVEFVVQAFQLIRGGRDTELQTPSLHAALEQLPELDLLTKRDVDELHADYVFLRDLEHALQAQQDRQTQTLPDDELGRARLALALGEESWVGLAARLEQVRSRVRQHFDAVISAPDDEEESGQDDSTASLGEWRALWQDALDDEEAHTLLEEAGFTDAAHALKRVRTLRQSRAVTAMQRVGFERLEALMPMLLAQIAEQEAPDTVLERVLPLVEAVLRRTAYLSLLRENPQALEQFVGLCAASAWISEQLARHPMLLDELLSPQSLYSPADKDQLRDELRQMLTRLPEEDEEAQLDALRAFRHSRLLHVAASDIAGARPLMKVSDYLTYIAEVVLEAVLAMAWRSVTQKYGYPRRHSGAAHEPSFIIVGYGKLGGIELGYGSDLDLVFIHDADAKGSTDGKRALDNPVFFTRLGQRIIHILTAATASGTLYEVDMRLRPSGNAGLLVTTLDAFTDYQHKKAWTWEHQALVRARAIVGDPELMARFEQVRRNVLSQRRDIATLRQEVVTMRHKMREHLGSSPNAREEGLFHLKQDPGGLVDIEFLNQFAVLAMSHEAPALMTYTDNIRIIETLESCGKLSAEEAEQLRTAYLALRNTSHRNSLTKHGPLVREAEFHAHREHVIAQWCKWLEDTPASET